MKEVQDTITSFNITIIIIVEIPLLSANFFKRLHQFLKTNWHLKLAEVIFKITPSSLPEVPTRNYLLCTINQRKLAKTALTYRLFTRPRVRIVYTRSFLHAPIVIKESNAVPINHPTHVLAK